MLKRFDFAAMGTRPVCLYIGCRHDFALNVTSHKILVSAGHGLTQPLNYFIMDKEKSRPIPQDDFGPRILSLSNLSLSNESAVTVSGNLKLEKRFDLIALLFSGDQR